jgi:plasmid stabilization system protein ParE
MAVRWMPSALAAYEKSLRYIADQDGHTAELIEERVAHSMALIDAHPGMGTPVLDSSARRYPIPRTGHGVNYVVANDGIRIVRWYRQRQDIKGK